MKLRMNTFTKLTGSTVRLNIYKSNFIVRVFAPTHIIINKVTISKITDAPFVCPSSARRTTDSADVLGIAFRQTLG